MADVAYLTTFRVPPENAFQAEVGLMQLHYAIGEEEFGGRGIEVFAVHRVVGDPGAYQIYEQYTKTAAARHGKGPMVTEAWNSVLARMVAPFERVLLEPLATFAARKEVGGDIAGDECWRYTIRVAPADAGPIEAIFDEIMDGMDVDEFSTGEVKTYNAHRIAGDAGRYVMYEHFTARGSAQHATGPSLREPGMRQLKLLVTPFHRLQLEPISALGTEHRNFGASAKNSLGRKR